MADHSPERPERTAAEESTSELLRRKDAKAIDKLLERYRPLLRAIIANEIDPALRAKVDPSDLVQDTCLEVVRVYPKVEFVRSKQFLTYLQQVLINKLHDIRRKYLLSKKRNVRLERTFLPDQAVDPTEAGMAAIDQMINEELCERTRQVLTELPLEIQKVLHMRFRKNMTYKQIGERIGRSEDDVRMLIKRCLNRLQQQLRSPSS